MNNNSKTSIDNIVFNIAVPNTVSGNLTASMSDQLPQFLVALNIFPIPFIQSPISMKETD